MYQDLGERLLKFAVDVLKFLKTIPRSIENDVIKYQLSKCSTSIGANYEESQGALSKADFYHKIKISLKESRETKYWFLIERIPRGLPRGFQVLFVLRICVNTKS